jgi:hypothetical protein
MYTKEELVKAIRSNKLIGSGTCSSIDECYEDSELWNDFGPDGGNDTIEAAVMSAIKREGLWIEKHVECRYGDDDDVELKIRDEWEAAKTSYFSD